MKLLAASLMAAVAAAGNVENGKAIATGGGEASCIVCHAIPGAARPGGDLGPSLAGVGGRMSASELKARIVDPSRINPRTAMPPYGRVDGLYDVAAQYRGKPLLTSEQIDDVAAFLATLK